jgi:hypothetical protein
MSLGAYGCFVMTRKSTSTASNCVVRASSSLVCSAPHASCPRTRRS